MTNIARSIELGKRWIFRSTLLIIFLGPLVISMLYFSTKYCPAGYYTMQTNLDLDIIRALITPAECVLCPAGQYSVGGISSVCTPCERGHYSNLPGANECLPCPIGSKSIGDSGGSTGCECLFDQYVTESKTGESLVCRPRAALGDIGDEIGDDVEGEGGSSSGSEGGGYNDEGMEGIDIVDIESELSNVDEDLEEGDVSLDFLDIDVDGNTIVMKDSGGSNNDNTATE